MQDLSLDGLSEILSSSSLSVLVMFKRIFETSAEMRDLGTQLHLFSNN